MGKAASMNPQEFVSGGAVPDGRYQIKKAQAVVFDYGGNGPETPAVAILFHSATDGSEYEQNYSAGKMEHLTPSEDGRRLVHPRGEDAHFGAGSNFGLFIKALIGAGFPQAELSDDVTSLEGSDVEIVNQAQPKRPGTQAEGKTIPLPTKYYGRAGKAATAKARPTAKPASATPASTAKPAASSNGDVDAQAIEQVIAALAEREGTTTVKLLGNAVMASVAKLKKERPEVFGNLVAIRKLATDTAWLAANAEAGGWSIDGDQVSLG